MKFIKLLLLFLLTVNFSRAQSDSTDTASAELKLKSDAQNMVQLFLRKDYDQYVKYVHPKVLRMVGGETRMIEGLKKSMKQMEEDGFLLTKVTIGKSQKIVSTTGELQAVVPQTLEFKVDQGRMVTTSYLLAISTNKGQKWQFIDTSGKTLEQMQKAFPTLSKELVIPPDQKPIYYND